MSPAGRTPRPARKVSARLLRVLMNLWPPYRGAGIVVRRIAPDYSEVRADLKLTWFNRNYVGTHFGGSMYAMTDPFFMLIVLHRLGPGYTVAHKAGSMEYLAPARGRVHATFRVSDAEIEAIRAATVGGERHLPTFEVDVTDDAGTVVARARHTLHVRRKAAAPTGGD